MNVIMVRGLPGSGKSTLIEDLLRAYPNAVRVSFDDLMVNAKMQYEWQEEHNEITLHHVKAFVVSLMNQKVKNILVDGFCSEDLVEPWPEFVRGFGYRFTSIVCENRHNGVSTCVGVDKNLIARMRKEFEVKL